MQGNRREPYHALLSLRATPVKADMKPPAELLNSRKYKATLPSQINPPIDQQGNLQKVVSNQDRVNNITIGLYSPYPYYPKGNIITDKTQ